MDRFAFAPRPPTARQWLGAVEVAAVLVLAVQAARLLWVFMTPLGPLGPVGEADAAQGQALARFAPLIRGGADPATAVAEASDTSGLVLFGVRFSGGAGGSAIIAGADGRQVSYAVGDAVAGGAVLRAVGYDFVTLDSGGQASRLEMGPPVPGATPPPPPAAAPPPPTSPAPSGSGVAPTVSGGDVARLAADAGLRSRLEDGRVTGYEVTGQADAAALQSYGVQAGDVLLSVNGQPLSPENVQGLQGSLQAGSDVSIQVERNGAVQTITVPTGRP